MTRIWRTLRGEGIGKADRAGAVGFNGRTAERPRKRADIDSLISSDRIRRLALQNTGCTTEYGTASVGRSLTVPTGA